MNDEAEETMIEERKAESVFDVAWVFEGTNGETTSRGCGRWKVMDMLLVATKLRTRSFLRLGLEKGCVCAFEIKKGEVRKKKRRGSDDANSPSPL